MTKSNRYEDTDIGTVINGFKYLGDLPKDVWQSNGKSRTCILNVNSVIIYFLLH